MTFHQVCWHVLLIAGVGIELLCCAGLVTLRSALDRAHCAGAVGFGAALVAIAVLVRESFSLIGDKALVIAVLLLFLNPVLVHATARTVRIRARGDWRIGAADDVELVER